MHIKDTTIISKEVDPMPVNVIDSNDPMRQEITPFDGFHVYIDNEAIDVIMASALDDVSYSWCKEVEAFDDYDPEEYEYLSDVFSQGVNLLFYPQLKSGKDISYRLTMSKFFNGLKMWLNEIGRDEADLYLDRNNSLIGSKVSPYDANKIIQYALFGKLIAK